MCKQELINVLAVDDDADFVDMLKAYLEVQEERLSIETATSASDGLSLLCNDEFDCVISDFEMPRTNGLEFLHAVQQECDEIPFIMFTGQGNEEIHREAIQAGVTKYLQKEGGTDQFSVLAEAVRESVMQ